MDNYYVYRENDYLICEKRNDNGKNEAINDLDEFYSIVDNLIEEGYQITIKNNDLVLNGNHTTFCINNFVEIIDCNYLRKLQGDITKTFKEKGISEWHEEKSIGTSDKRKAINKLRKIKTIGFNFAVVAAMFTSTLVINPHAEEILDQPIKLCKPEVVSAMMEVAENNEKMLELNLAQDDKDVFVENYEQIKSNNLNDDDPEQMNMSEKTDDEVDKDYFSDEEINVVNISINEDPTMLKEDWFEKVYYFDAGRHIADDYDIYLTTPNETDDEATIYDNYIATYARYYHLDTEKVVDLARKMTNNYETPLQDINNTDHYDMNNQEAAALIFVNQLKRNKLAIPCSKYGYDSSDDLVVDDSIETINSNLMLSSGYSFSEFVGKVADLLGVDRNYVLAISYSEAGRETDSNLARTKNNFGGIRGNGEFVTYPTPEAGIIGLCRTLKKFENSNFNSIKDLCLVYVGYYSQDWINNVKHIHDEVEKNSNLFFINGNKGKRNIVIPEQKVLVK